MFKSFKKNTLKTTNKNKEDFNIERIRGIFPLPFEKDSERYPIFWSELMNIIYPIDKPFQNKEPEEIIHYEEIINKNIPSNHIEIGFPIKTEIFNPISLQKGFKIINPLEITNFIQIVEELQYLNVISIEVDDPREGFLIDLDN